MGSSSCEDASDSPSNNFHFRPPIRKQYQRTKGPSCAVLCAASLMHVPQQTICSLPPDSPCTGLQTHSTDGGQPAGPNVHAVQRNHPAATPSHLLERALPDWRFHAPFSSPALTVH